MFDFRVSKTCLDKCSELLKKSILPEFKKGNERPLKPSDFDQVKEQFQNCASTLKEFLSADVPEDLEPVSSLVEIDEFFTLLLIFCGENCEVNYWTTDKTLDVCHSVYATVVGSDESRLLLLTRDHCKIVKKILSMLRPCLLSDSWKTYPTAVCCYTWCLFSLKAPHVGENLDTLLPTALIITDDFIAENKAIGIKCLHHIIDNTSLGELRVRSYDEVIYKTLEGCFLQRDALLLPDLMSCLLALLGKIYFLSTQHYTQWSHYDDVMTKLLYQLKLESQPSAKESMLESLIKVISASGLLSVRYIGPVIEIIEEPSVQPSLVLLKIRVVNELLVTCHPCIKHHLKQITFIILKILYTSDVFEPETREKVEEACADVLKRVHVSNSCLLKQLMSSPQFDLLQGTIQSMVKQAVTAAS